MKQKNVNPEKIHRMLSSRKIIDRLWASMWFASHFFTLSNKDEVWDLFEIIRKDENSEVRGEAAFSLGFAFANAPDKDMAWDLLRPFTEDRDPDARGLAAYGLGMAFANIPDKNIAWTILHNLTEDTDFFVRRGATCALGLAFLNIVDKKAAWNDLQRLSIDGDSYVRRESAFAIGSVFCYIPDKNAAKNAILLLTQDTDTDVRVYAYYSAGKISIQTASCQKTDRSFRSEFKKAVHWFEQSYQESEKSGKNNPARICYPLYRAFYAVTFQKKDSKEKVEEFLSEAKKALTGSETREQLRAIIENLSNAIKEVEKVSSASFSTIQHYLNTCSVYCDKAEVIIGSVERKMPVTAQLMRRVIEKSEHDIDFQIREYAFRVNRLVGSQISDTVSDIEKNRASLMRIEDKVDKIHVDLISLRKIFLNRFDENEQKLLKIIITGLEIRDLRMIDDITDALNSKKIGTKDKEEIKIIVEKTCGMLAEVQNNLTEKQEEFRNIITDFIELQKSFENKSSEYYVRHRLVVTLPLIPYIMNYTLIYEAQTGGKIRLLIKPLWDRLRVIGKKIQGRHLK